jgi:hypothetical protein
VKLWCLNRMKMVWPNKFCAEEVHLVTENKEHIFLKY